MTQQQERTDTSHLFVSYSSKDRWFATLLLSRLANHPDVSIFSTQDLSAAKDFRPRIKEELRAASAFLVLLSRRSVESNWVLYELGAAWALGKPIIVVLMDPDVRSRIPVDAHKLHVLELENPNEPGAIDNVLAYLHPNGSSSTSVPQDMPGGLRRIRIVGLDAERRRTRRPSVGARHLTYDNQITR